MHKDADTRHIYDIKDAKTLRKAIKIANKLLEEGIEYGIQYIEIGKEDVEWVCEQCGEKNGVCRAPVSTWHLGNCDICGRKAEVTQGRDYGIYEL